MPSRRFIKWCWSGLVQGLLATCCGAVQAAPAAGLPALGADISQTSVSGLSSGAFMASQFSVAYSSIVVGAGLVAGGPYYCAGFPGSFLFIPYLVNALGSCMNPAAADAPPPQAAQSWNAANSFAQASLIDPTAQLKRQRIYLFSGTSDQTVTRVVVDQNRQFYALAGLPPEQVRYVNNVNAGHALLTDHQTDQACPLTAPPYINDCDIRQASDILHHIYPGLQPPAAVLSGKTLKFNQRTFLHSAYSSMSNEAYLYIPQSCNTRTCRVHVVFHGCNQGAAVLGDRFYTGAGYNEVADANDLIVLYPQVEPSQVYPYNPRGCWDFWGYTSVNPFFPNFYTKDAIQLAAVKAMLDRLARPRRAMRPAVTRP